MPARERRARIDADPPPPLLRARAQDTVGRAVGCGPARAVEMMMEAHTKVRRLARARIHARWPCWRANGMRAGLVVV